ncbi:MAG: ABC transporter permease [Acidobacteria bacterium]|nr:ABC transporter permease [Acidobacteriota bacterium]
MVDSLFQDIRYALRTSLRSPGFTSVAILALALGIGANTAIFTLVNAALIERLPFHDPDRLVVLWETNARRPGRPNTIGPANFIRWRERATAFDQMAGIYDDRVNLTGGGAPEELIAMAVEPGFFSTLGVAPLIGRTFAADEGPDGRDALAVLTFDLWRRRFGGDPAIVGRAVQINGRPVTIIGVMPRDVRLVLKNGSLVGKPADLWVPFAFTEAQRQPRGRYMSAIARLKPTVSLSEAQAQMNAIETGLATEFPQFDTGWGALLVPMHRELSGELRPALLVLSGAVAFVLLIACANVANLLLAHGAVRRREMAIRSALGASRARMIRQLLTESLVLGISGGALGLLVAQWSLAGLAAFSPVDLGSLGHVRLSYPVLAFTAFVSLATSVICGLAPAYEIARAGTPQALKDGARGAGSGVHHRRMRQLFVVSEIALAVVLLVGAGLLLRSFAALSGVNPGFDSRNVLTARVTVPISKYSTDASRLDFFRQAVARVAELSGVESAGAISFLPLAGLGAGTGFTIVGQPAPAAGQGPVTDVRVCDTGYFRSMRVPLLRGRLFSEPEMRERRNVVVINDTLARKYFPGQDPTGQRLTIAMNDPIVPTEIIGVVGDMKVVDLATETRPMTYWPPPQLAYGAMTLTIRTASDPAGFAPLVEREIHALDKDQPLADVRTMDQWVSRTLAQSRFSSMLLSAFAGLALLLAALGIYGVMSYAVSQRTAEIGVRLALGAGTGDVLRMVIASGLRLAAVGLSLGVMLALALSRTLTTLLYETAAIDPLTFAAAVGILGVIAIAACLIPARRAARITPVSALRAQ